MKNRLTNIITVMIITALCGLVALQVYFLRNAYNQEKQIFNNNVIAVLNDMSKSLEEEEAASGIVDYVYDVRGIPSPDSTGRITKTFLFKGKPRYDSSRVLGFNKTVKRKEGEFFTSESIVINNDTLRNSQIFIAAEGSSDSIIKKGFKYKFGADSNHIAFSYRFDDIIDTLKRLDSTRKTIIVSNVINKMILADRIAIQNRIPQKKLDSLLNSRFSKSGIDIPYKYSLYSGLRDSLGFVYGNDSLLSFKNINTKTDIFASDILPFRNVLVVDFPSKGMFIYKQIIVQIILSVLFISLIVFGFLYTIRTIRRQEKIAGHVVNFINNMTHEFKTPISTIAIASDAIGKSEILNDKDKVCRYNTVIKQENTRMRQQVEKILEMSVIEEGEYDLKIEKLNVHELIQNAAESFSVRLENSNGIINYDFKAAKFIISGDRLHITNIFNNVLDNAIKYSEETPVINITTVNSPNRFHVIIRDNGIGIRAQDLKKVFEKYYRVPTGNVHNVKGFGLGLSYVKLMVEAHKGQIDIASSFGKGTTVELIFPEADE